MADSCYAHTIDREQAEDMAVAALARRNEDGIAVASPGAEAEVRRAAERSGERPRAARPYDHWLANQPPDAVVFAENTEEVQRYRARLRRSPHSDHPLRHRLLAGGTSERPLGRHLGRSFAHEPHSCRPCRGSRLRGRARRHPQAAQRLPPRYRAVLPDRPRRRREPWRHGCDARLRHQRRALRHDEGQRPESDRRHAGRLAS